MKHAKMLAIVAVAVFCASAFAIAIDTTDSSADGEKLTYSFYIELNDGTHNYSGRLADVEVDGAAATGDTYQTAFTNACTAAGLTAVFGGSNMISSVTASEVTYAGSPGGDWGTDHYYNFAVYYYKDNAWKATEDFTESTMFIINFDKYAFEQPADASKYYKNGDDPYAYWTLLPAVKMVEYKIYIQCDDGADHSFSKWISSTQPGISGNSLKSARILGAKAAGFELVNGTMGATSVKSVTADGYTYKTHGDYPSDPAQYADANYWGWAGYCQDGDKNEWKILGADDLTSATVLAHTFNKYYFVDPSDNTYTHHEAAHGMGEYWTKSAKVLPNGDEPSKKGNDNLVLYIVIGVVAVVAVAAIAFFLLKKKA